MTIHEKIKEFLKYGNLRGVLVQANNGQWKMFTHVDDRDRIYGTETYENRHECFNGRLSNYPWRMLGLEQEFKHNLIPVHLKIELFNRADNVVFFKDRKEMILAKGTIVKVNIGVEQEGDWRPSYLIDDGYEYRTISHFNVFPNIEEMDANSKLEENAKEIKEALDGIDFDLEDKHEAERALDDILQYSMLINEAIRKSSDVVCKRNTYMYIANLFSEVQSVKNSIIAKKEKSKRLYI